MWVDLQILYVHTQASEPDQISRSQWVRNSTRPPPLAGAQDTDQGIEGLILMQAGRVGIDPGSVLC